MIFGKQIRMHLPVQLIHPSEKKPSKKTKTDQLISEIKKTDDLIEKLSKENSDISAQYLIEKQKDPTFCFFQSLIPSINKLDADEQEDLKFEIMALVRSFTKKSKVDKQLFVLRIQFVIRFKNLKFNKLNFVLNYLDYFVNKNPQIYFVLY